MKKKRENEEMVKVSWRIPSRLKESIDALAVKERRSVNDQAIVLLEKALGKVDL